MTLNVVERLRRVPGFAVMGSLVAALVICLLYAGEGVDSEAVMMVFSHDESDQTQRMFRLIQQDTLDTGGVINGFYSYGQFYPTIVFGIAKALSIIGLDPLTFRDVAVIMKLVSCFFYAASIVGLWVVLRCFKVDKTLAAAFSFALLAFPDYWTWATVVHPDTAQMFTLLLPVWAALRIGNWTSAAILSAFLVGVSFGTKYNGLFMSAFVAFFVCFYLFLEARASGHRRPVVNRLIFRSALCINAFIFGWLIFNPFVLMHFPKFFDEVTNQADYLRYGVGVTLDQNGFKWFTIYADQFGFALSVFMAVGVVGALVLNLAAYRVWFAGRDEDGPNTDTVAADLPDREQIVITSLAFYLVVASLYLIVVVKYREIRYAYHIVPVLLILSAYGLDRIARRLLGTVLQQSLVPLAISAVMIMVALPGFLAGLNQASDKFVERRDNEVIRAGDWVAAKYTGENSVLAGTYSYVPEDHFNRLSYTYELNFDQIDSMKPSLIVMNDSVPGRYAWKQKGSLLKDVNIIESPGWEDRRMVESYGAMMRAFARGETAYRLVYESETVMIFERNTR